MLLLALLCLPLTALGQGSNSPAATLPSDEPPVSAPCPVRKVNLDLPSTTLDQAQGGATSVSGSISKKSTSGSVRLCSAGKQLGNDVPVDPSTGKFVVSGLDSLANGEEIQAEFGNRDGIGPASTKLVVGSCAGVASSTGKAPTLTISIDPKGTAKYSGTLPGGTEKTEVQICVNGVAVGKPITLDANGKFDGGTNTISLKSGDKVQVQAPGVPLSNEVTITASVSSVADTGDKAVAVLIGGVEYAGYSAQSQTTNGFLNIFYQGPVHWKRLTGWGRMRLTSAPQKATNGVVSVISNPTGLTTTDYSNVGQAFDYVAGPSVKLAPGWNFVAGFGATTPLSSQNTPITFVAPPFGSNECTELVSRFSAANGYSPALSLNTAPSPTTCLAGGYTNIAFSNEDRSSFLLKYGAGFRTTYNWKFGDCKDKSDSSGCSAYSTLDIGFGQDASVTGGKLSGWVFKLDGVMPIPTGNSSLLYLFGSSYIRLKRNQTLPPLLLQTPNPPISVPSATVVVLPLRQPNRDYYRLGVGLNITQLWCKAFGSNCTDSSQAAKK
jgi:hypothetical protein